MAHSSRLSKGGRVLWAGALAALVASAPTRPAQACGCFTPPDPSVPVVQAGERIAFAMSNGEITAHIQIQYAGDAKDFGWLLPLPSIPTLELGTDELFNQLITTTQPKYRLNRVTSGNCAFNPNFQGRGAPSAADSKGGGGAGGEDGGMSPLVIEDSIGPYDYAVLRADSKDAMLNWLAENRYFVPAGTDETVGAYIRPNAYFLALKLRSGQSAGDLQPVVLKYASDLPMIPIVLTSVAAQPDMGIQVWMLGRGRAIPRNYYHTVISDRFIDWQNSGGNYNDVIIRAVSEAPQKHSFVTEYAGTSRVMQGILDYEGRFGSLDELRAQNDALAFVRYLQQKGYAFTSQMNAILGRYIPMPAGLAAQGVTPAQFYQQLDYFLTYYRSQDPSAFEGWSGIDYQPDAMAKDIDERVIVPTRAAAALFDTNPYLSRLYTTLSPEDMTLDPVFSFNRGLPDVNNVHEATLTYYCGPRGTTDQDSTPARLVTEQGWSFDYPNGTGPSLEVPEGRTYSMRIEILREEGDPEIVKESRPGGGGCGIGGDSDMPAWWLGGAALLGLVLVRRRRGV